MTVPANRTGRDRSWLTRFRQQVGLRWVLLLAVVISLLGLPEPPRANDKPAPGTTGHLVGHGGPVRAIAGDPLTGHLLTGSFDYAMMLWRIGDEGAARQVKRFDDHDGAVSAVAFHPDGKHALSGSDDGALHMWDLATAKRVRIFKGHGAKILGLAIDRAGKRALTASWDRTVRLWDVASGKVIHTLKGHTGPVNAVAFTSSGDGLLSAANDGTIRLWQADTGALQRIAHRHGWGINVMRRLGDTDRYLFGALDGTAAIFDLAANKINTTLKAHDKPVLSLAVLDKPGLIATGGGGGHIRVYRQDDWKLLESFHNPLGPVWAMAFADRGARVYFGSLDDFATSWQVKPRKPFEQVSGEFPRRFQVSKNLSLGERQFARKCSICHTLTPNDANRAGPTLHRIFGRKAGTLPNYPYSKALKSANLTWNEETIGKLFSLGPHDYLPGSKMPLQQISDNAKRNALIEFLKQSTGGPVKTDAN
ncbi:MAG: c-type cytochrome [Hyphomicrobiaceae bacterium]